MVGTPMDVSIALSMLIADVTNGAFAHRVITFSEEPTLVDIPKAEVRNLGERTRLVRGMNWGYNTDFQKVFELLLEKAKVEQIPTQDA